MLRAQTFPTRASATASARESCGISGGAIEAHILAVSYQQPVGLRSHPLHDVLGARQASTQVGHEIGVLCLDGLLDDSVRTLRQGGENRLATCLDEREERLDVDLSSASGDGKGWRAAMKATTRANTVCGSPAVAAHLACAGAAVSPSVPPSHRPTKIACAAKNGKR